MKAKVIQYDSTFNFDDLVAFYTPKEDSVPEDTTSSGPLQFHFSNIELKGAEFIYDDKTINKTTTLNDLSFFIPYIGWNQDEKSEADLRFSFKKEGYFESSINVDPIGGDFEANIKIYHLYLQAFQDYVTSNININAFQGMLNSDLAITGNINEAEKSIVSGSIEVVDFLMKDKQDKEFLGARKLDCRLKTIDYFNSSYVIDSIILTQPYVYFELDTATNNFFEIFNITEEEEDTMQVAEVSADTLFADSSNTLYYAINHLVLKNGIVDYRDNLTGEPFRLLSE